MISKIASGEKLFAKKNIPVIVTLYVTIFILLALIVVFYFFAVIPVSGDSMEGTIYNGQNCVVLKKCYTVNRGDIVTLNTENSDKKEHILIKRVIGMEGDKIVFLQSSDGSYVDLYICKSGENHFNYVNEPYIKERMLYPKNSVITVFSNVSVLKNEYTNDITERLASDVMKSAYLSEFVITVPKDSFFFLGDNRNSSRDSRYYGTRTLSHITAKVLFVI